MKPKLLYIGHAFHNKTKSSLFVQNLLSEKYEVTKFDYDPHNEGYDVFSRLNSQRFDVVVLFQTMPSLSLLGKYIEIDKVAFFPMYDSALKLKNPIWSEYRNVNIINFSLTLHKKCKEYGLSSYYIQYFPKPIKVNNWGDENSVFLWQRKEEINPHTIEKTIGEQNVKNLCLHQVPDPGRKIIHPSEKWKNKVRVSNWFDTKEEMLEYMQQSAIYYAPRSYEGIGMSFLDAMAMGRCVIAPNHPTMNEYIENGVNGYLYNLKHPNTIKIKDIRKIQKNAVKYIENGYKEWEKNKYKILNWIQADAKKNNDPELMDSKLSIRQPKRFAIKLPLLKRIYTRKYEIFYIFGFIPIKIPNRNGEKI